MAFKIVTDSATDLPREIIEEYQLHVIPTPVTINGTDYFDGDTIFPEEFYKISDYSTKASANPNDADYARKRGFVANPLYGSEWCTYVNWQTKTLLQSDDLNYFLSSILRRTSEQWASDLTYPLVKQKYDILVDHFKKEYNLDLTKIGNATY